MTKQDVINKIKRYLLIHEGKKCADAFISQLSGTSRLTYKIKSDNFISVGTVLDYVLHWKETKEGFYYWKNLKDKYIDVDVRKIKNIKQSYIV